VRRLVLGTPSSPQDVGWTHGALKLIEQASHEDIEAIFDDFTIAGTYTPTRTLNTTTAALPDLIAFVATLVSDIQKRGQHRTGA
jgi:hypothetical protein